ncbi:MAG TPA: uroporphyrinogen-III synthase [Steroidobacteraceae bacterium]|jgi:uroporphyrinogen-III synthase|nr:uroporphyrinogen-III synthase [Steroidobacteraceae bacterium]
MQSKTVAILESRTGEHLARLIERRGAVPLLAPALEEVPDVDAARLDALIDGWRGDPFAIVIFQTGVGTRALFQATDSSGRSAELLALIARATVVVRGPKPIGELNVRGVRIDRRAAAPFTTETVLAAMADVPVEGARVLVQRYGAANRQLCAALQARAARAEEIATYRWALPADTRPLRELLAALRAARVDAVVFTSAVQVEHLFQIAGEEGSADLLPGLLGGLTVGSIGPVCSRALRQRGVEPTFEADPPKLGPLVAGLDRALSAAGRH